MIIRLRKHSNTCKTYLIFITRKKVFLVLNDLSWNVFRKTGDIETYLLMKELESQDQQFEMPIPTPDHLKKDTEDFKG